MNRALIIIVILAALGAGGYFLMQSNANRVAEEAAAAEAAAAEQATAEAAVAAEAAGDAALAQIFSAEGFDFDQAVAALEAADIPAVTRTAVTTALEGARDNPALLEAALAQARAALGIAQ